MILHSLGDNLPLLYNYYYFSLIFPFQNKNQAIQQKPENFYPAFFNNEIHVDTTMLGHYFVEALVLIKTSIWPHVKTHPHSIFFFNKNNYVIKKNSIEKPLTRKRVTTSYQ